MAAAPRAREAVLAGVVAFVQLLRSAGVRVSPAEVETAIAALSVITAADRDEAYWALRCSLLSAGEDGDAFDGAFALWWDAEGPSGTPWPSRADEGDDGGAPMPNASTPATPEAVDEGDGDEDEAPGESPVWSAREHLRDLDFRDYGPAELAAARRLVERLGRALPPRRSRRWHRRGREGGARLDHRQTLRAAMRTEGDALALLWRERRMVPRRVVFVIDVSGSMQAYARPMILFLQALRRTSPRVEAFVFGTRLTRLTTELASGDPARALAAAAKAAPDWGGGTRIGENLAVLNATWGPRGVTRGATVVIVSDGWERGDAGQVGVEMHRLKRTAHSVVWVNPLAGEEGYEPLAAGMAAALPHVDVFLPGQNLRHLEALAGVLGTLRARPRGRG